MVASFTRPVTCRRARARCPTGRCPPGGREDRVAVVAWARHAEHRSVGLLTEALGGASLDRRYCPQPRWRRASFSTRRRGRRLEGRPGRAIMQPTGAAELKIHGPAGVIPTPDGAANDGGDPHANGANGDGAEISVGCRPARSAPGAPGRARRRLLGTARDRPGRVHGQDRRHVQRDRRREPEHGRPARARRAGRRPGGQDAAARPLRPHDRRLGRDGSLGQHADRRPALADHGGHARHRGGGAGRPAADRAARGGRPAAQGRVPALGHDRQHDDRAAQRVHLRGDARGARGRHRRQARRPGAGAGRSPASGRT